MSSEPVNELQVPANIPTSLDVEGAASKIAAYSIQDPKYPTIQIQSTKLRLRILQRAHIKVGSKVLEVGCGQGDSTAVLAVAVGESGKVVAVDPGPPDYGTPLSSILFGVNCFSL
jgi:protein-L-isoaspartate O-methyltransferase